jgi:hypothetical protein
VVIIRIRERKIKRMRYFAVMDDGRIAKASDIYHERSTGCIYFNVNNTRFKYDPDPYTEVFRRDVLRLSSHRFYRYYNNEWYVERSINYLLELNETEDEEMNYFQSTDFNAGVIYTRIEKSALSMLKGSSALCMDSISIPYIQLVPKNCGSVKEADTIKATISAVSEHFKAVYGKNFNLDIHNYERDKQYFKFSYIVRMVPNYKEMTISQIEEALGYKIKVIGD